MEARNLSVNCLLEVLLQVYLFLQTHSLHTYYILYNTAETIYFVQMLKHNGKTEPNHG